MGYLEIDSHTDTHCFGRNFVAEAFTGQVCDVAPFLLSYGATRSIPVCTGITAYDQPDSRETMLLEYPQGLFFGEKMDQSLINPNQSRMHGIGLWNDAWDHA